MSETVCMMRDLNETLKQKLLCLECGFSTDMEVSVSIKNQSIFEDHLSVDKGELELYYKNPMAFFKIDRLRCPVCGSRNEIVSLDPLMEYAIYNLNNIEGIRTDFCCEGHIDKIIEYFNKCEPIKLDHAVKDVSLPYIEFENTKHKNLGKFLDIVSHSEYWDIDQNMDRVCIWVNLKDILHNIGIDFFDFTVYCRNPNKGDPVYIDSEETLNKEVMRDSSYYNRAFEYIKSMYISELNTMVAKLNDSL